MVQRLFIVLLLLFILIGSVFRMSCLNHLINFVCLSVYLSGCLCVRAHKKISALERKNRTEVVAYLTSSTDFPCFSNGEASTGDAKQHLCAHGGAQIHVWPGQEICRWDDSHIQLFLNMDVFCIQ